MLDAALTAWRDLLGGEGVSVDAAELGRASTATFATSVRPSAILRPSDRAQVQECLRIATRFGKAIYPVSGGKNWGFGSRVPTSDGAALLDLGRMNRIRDFDEELGTITVEPGVTFRQAYDFLKRNKSRLFLATTGGSPDASIIGNAVERGDGSGPYGDRIEHVCALEVVLATGELLQTGFSRFEGTPLGPIHRSGVGPALDGLFAQSNLGVVTALTAWLAPLPRSLSAVRFSIRDPARLAAMIDALCELRLDGTLRSVAGIWNDYRVLSTRGGYPWQAAGGKLPLERTVLASMSHAWGGATWFGLTAIYAASAAQGAAHRLHVERVLRPAVDELLIEERHGEPASGAELFHEQDPGFSFLQGIPHEASLRSVYWRKRGAIPDRDLDPDRDRCGVLWSCPTLPYRGADVTRATAIAERLMLEHGFEPLLAMVAQSERTVYLIPLLIYDRDEPEADERALAAHDALLTEFAEHGYLPYRLGIQSMGALPPARDDSGSVLGRIKQALDPAGVLAPGRYDFWRR
jgi:4-cresol dehydrogenase (hydroxylating) flavoprotein subunit